MLEKYIEPYELYYDIFKMMCERIEVLEKEKETILDYIESVHEEVKAMKAEKGGK